MAQSSQSQRVVTLVAVCNGVVCVANAGGTGWSIPVNGTTNLLNTTGVVRSAVNNQNLWFADGVHWFYYNPSINTVLPWVASAGVLPADSAGNTPRLICTWRGRTVLSGLLKDGQNWFMSRVNDPTDYNYFPTPVTATQPVSGNNSTLGLVGDVVTSLVPYNDDLLVTGGDHSLWVFNGDPMAGGQINNISSTIGMAWGIPWERDPYGTIYFVSNKMGIYTLMPGQGPPVRISQQIEQLLQPLVNTGANLIRLIWDDPWQGLHVFVTTTSGAASATHFFWEQRTGAWWTDVFGNNNLNPLCCCTFDGNLPGDRHPLIGSWDGFVRTITPLATNDDGTAISSSVVIGPLLTRDLDDVIFKEIQAHLASGTVGAVTYEVFVGSTAEIALANSPISSGTWTAGRNLDNFVRASGHAIWVELTATTPWAMEALRCAVGGKGKVRRRSTYST